MRSSYCHLPIETVSMQSAVMHQNVNCNLLYKLQSEAKLILKVDYKPYELILPSKSCSLLLKYLIDTFWIIFYFLLLLLF